MKKTFWLLIIVGMLSLLMACGQTETDEELEETENGTDTEETAVEEEPEDEASENENTETEEAESEEEQPSASEDANEEEAVMTEEIIDGSYEVYGHRDFDADEELIVFSFQRSEQQLPLEDRFMASLKESVETDKLEELERISAEGTAASLYFTENEQLQSMASAEQLYFTDMLYDISSLYGIDTLHFYVGDEPGIDFGQTGRIETLEVEAPKSRGFYVYGDIDGTRTYISGVAAEEVMTNDDGDLMDFVETVNKMQSVQDSAAYHSGISEGIEIIDVSVHDALAEVHYNSPDAQTDISDFENVLQLAALDFHMQELHLINQEQEQAKIYLFD